MFETASTHLDEGGLFLFDVWYGPAVAEIQPTVRIKTMKDELSEVIRIAEPVRLPRENVIEVNYRVLVKDRRTNVVQEFSEIHRMRYFFEPELELLASQCDLDLVRAEEWMSGSTPSTSTWGVCFVARKR